MEPEQYGTLELLEAVTAKNGASVKEIVIYRPSCKIMLEVLDTFGNAAQTAMLVKSCVRGLNGGAEPLELASLELNAADGNEIADVITALLVEADKVRLPPDSGDGVTAPLVYTLRRPIKLSPRDDAEMMLTQIEFQARRMREVTEFLDATTRGEQFRAFMRLFGKPMGIAVPIMTDTLINSLDAVDYLVIRGPLIMGKLTTAQGRWKKTVSPLH
jgi:hypothetical protein